LITAVRHAHHDAMQQTPPTIDAGSTAWMLVSSALVLLMRGLVKRRNAASTDPTPSTTPATSGDPA